MVFNIGDEWVPPERHGQRTKKLTKWLQSSFSEDIAAPSEDVIEFILGRLFSKLGLRQYNPPAVEDFDADWEKQPKRRFREIIVDPLAFYVPYHLYPDKWGIYFRFSKIVKDFARLLRAYPKLLTEFMLFAERIYIHGIRPILLELLSSRSAPIDSFVSAINHGRTNKVSEELERNIKTLIAIFQLLGLYLEHIAIHEYTHHLIEDIATIKERSNVIDYRSVYGELTAAEEEGFCEYIAFSRLVKPRITRDLGDFFKFIGLKTQRSWWRWLREAESYGLLSMFKSILYNYWGRREAYAYKPVIRPRIVKYIDIYWSLVAKSHRDGDPILVNGEGIDKRIFWTML